MSIQKTNGYSFEYALINELNDLLILKGYNCQILKNKQFENVFLSFEKLEQKDKDLFIKASKVAAFNFIEIEKDFLNNNKNLTLSLQDDNQGKVSDVRDILISNENGETIGISCKNNNNSAKHSRISPKIDFIKTWFKSEDGASKEFLENLTNVFSSLKENRRKRWEDVYPDHSEKAKLFYEPILILIKDEINNHLTKDNSQSVNLFKYIIGMQDFYKIIKNDESNKIIIQAFNFNGNLDKSIEKTIFPTKILNSYFRPSRTGENNKLILEFDNDWILCLRIHNASSKIENSFKFDIKIEKSPDLFKKEFSF